VINDDVRHIIEPELSVGEKLLWADKPRSGPYVIIIYGVFFLILFAIVFLIPMLVAILTGDTSNLKFDYNGVPASNITDASMFVMLSLMIVSFLLISIWTFLRCKSSIYAITNKRLYFHARKWPMKVSSVLPQAIGTIVRDGSHDIGTLIFIEQRTSVIVKLFKPNSSYLHPRFLKIKNPKQVEDLIYKTFLNKDQHHE